MHGAELTVVLFLCVALALGALTRISARRLRLPYTVAVLLVGLALGLVLGRLEPEGGWLARLDTGTEISSDLIIFVFLPALIFESAFALDVHAFRKELAGVAILAVPALLLSTAAVGGLMVALTGMSWGWSLLAALVFGALISATDPVAVVAILRETSSPERLGILIEGESLLNDGTAIVLFTALLALLGSPGAELAIGSRALGFVWVVGGGVAVGVVLAIVACELMARVFNDPLIEITLTIVVAYAAMMTAEAGLHVSGVMAIVAAGLYMAGPGRTRISPEVQHFLHQFWEMVSFLANTLIFFLVGLLVAAQWRGARPTDLLLIGAAYVGVMAIRFAVVFASRPAVALVGDPIGRREGVLMSWGGLRGAVSLALALIVSQREELPVDLRHQILLVTTGVVLLTIIINGSTVAWLLARLGLTERGPGERIAALTVEAALLDSVAERLRASEDAEELRLVHWDEVLAEVSARRDRLERELAEVREALASAEDDTVGYWRQALNVERRTYWRLYAHGMLGGSSAQHLDRAIALQLDRLGGGDHAAPASRAPRKPDWRHRMIGGLPFLARLGFHRFARDYELARAETFAASEVLAELGSLPVDAAPEIVATYGRYRRHGKERVEEIRAGLPEVAEAIELRLAQRIRLNTERAAYEEGIEHGAIDPDIGADALAEIQREMKRLLRAPTRIPIPETADIVRHLPLFEGLSDSELEELAAITEEVVFEPGETIIEEGDVGDSMHVIARGAVHVIKSVDGEPKILEVLGGGEIVGEMSLLTDDRRFATVRAATLVTAGRVSAADFRRVMEAEPGLGERIWQRFDAHRFDNSCRAHPRFSGLSREQQADWLGSGQLLAGLEADAVIDPSEHAHIYLVSGALEVDGSVHRGPAIVEIEPHAPIQVTEPARVIRLPEPPA